MIFRDIKFGTRIFISFLGIALIMTAVAAYSLWFNSRILEESIIQHSTVSAENIINRIDNVVFDRVSGIIAFIDNPTLHETLQKSNTEFKKLPNRDEVITKRDREWISAFDEKELPFMQDALQNERALELRGIIQSYEKMYEHPVFSEIFITNAYGVNIAQSGRTTDYYQADEDWWIHAKQTGMYTENVEFDESANEYAIPVSIRIDNADGEFLGVIKILLNIENVIDEAKRKYSGKGYQSVELKLINNEGIVLFDSSNEFSFLEDISETTLWQESKSVKSFSFKKGEHGEKEELITFARPNEGIHTSNIDWMIALEIELKEIFAPITKLRNILIFLFVIVFIGIIALSFFLAHSISHPIRKARDVAIEISQGNMDVEINTPGRNEIAELLQAIDNMRVSLKLVMEEYERAMQS